MNYETYAPTLEKARAVLAEKELPKPGTSFADVHVSKIWLKVFRYTTKVRRKIMRRLGL